MSPESGEEAEDKAVEKTIDDDPAEEVAGKEEAKCMFNPLKNS